MKKFRQNKTFEQELASKADEFQMQPSADLWNKIDSALAPAPTISTLPGKTIAFSTLALILLLSAGVYIFSVKTEVSETGVFQNPQAIAPSNEKIYPKANAGAVLEDKKISEAVSKESSFLPKQGVQPTVNGNKVPSPGSSIEVITTPEMEAPTTKEILKAEEATAELPDLTAELEKTTTESGDEEVKKEQKTSVKPHQKRIDVDINYTGGYGGRMLEAKNEMARPVLNHRKKYDEATPAHNARLAVKYYINNGFALSIGLGYNQWGEQMSLSKKAVSPYYDSLAQANGYSSEELYSIGTDRKFTNKYHSLELPVMLHFERFHRNRWHLRSALGIAFTTGIGETYKVYDYAVNHFVSEPEIIRNYNVNLQGNITVAYSLGSRINVYLGPEVRYSFFSIYKDSYPIRQNQYALGLSMGIQYKLRPVFKDKSNPLKNR